MGGGNDEDGCRGHNDGPDGDTRGRQVVLRPDHDYRALPRPDRCGRTHDRRDPLAFFLWKWFHPSKMNIIFTDDDVDESAMIEKSDYYGNRFARHINPMHAASSGEGAFAGDDAGMGGV